VCAYLSLEGVSDEAELRRVYTLYTLLNDMITILIFDTFQYTTLQLLNDLHLYQQQQQQHQPLYFCYIINDYILPAFYYSQLLLLPFDTFQYTTQYIYRHISQLTHFNTIYIAGAP